MKLLTKILFLSILFGGCSKDDSGGNPQQSDTSTQIKTQGSLSATMEAGNGALENYLDGNVIVTQSNIVVFDFYVGSIYGDVIQDENTYEFSNLTGSGIFEGSILKNGTLNPDENSFELFGTYIDNTNLVINGDLKIILEGIDVDAFRDDLISSSAWFTHNNECNASITINGETLQNIESHYSEGGLCSDTYGGNTGMYGSESMIFVDFSDSRTWCETITLWDEKNQTYNVHTICPAAQFVVDKNTQYNYSVVWEDGTTQNGSFTSADGGASKCLFIANSTTNCEEEETGNKTELVVDFEMVPNCCPPATATGKYFDYVEIDFYNKSVGDGLEYLWIFGNSAGSYSSTAQNPTEFFSLNNYYTENTVSVTLSVTDQYGNTEILEKSIDLPMLQPVGTITVDGITCHINYENVDPGYWLLDKVPYYYSSYGDGSNPYSSYEIDISESLLDFFECDFGLSGLPWPSIRIGGTYPAQSGSLSQSEEQYVSDNSRYYVRFGNWETFESQFSSGGVTLATISDGHDMIAAISLEGQLKNSPTADPIDFEIDISWIGNVCSYNSTSLFCTNQP